ncbi:hypothetical protein L2E82_07499 [Cichorium intybus]|uniref:Uncharacterized protein n=1 Tax=Cichorium intybus TaxID=13427 RepID=A0ACB9G6A1_CICIN|nr:hypothetical protein L2E82_07499 [Cichorium intybus]
MDLIHKFIYIVSVILSVVLFVFFLPPYLLFWILRFCIKSVFREKLAGKVVLIIGASSGIGEELLTAVAGKAKELGAPEAIVIKVDVSKRQDCKRFVDETIKHFGKCEFCYQFLPAFILLAFCCRDGCKLDYFLSSNIQLLLEHKNVRNAEKL